MMHDQLKDQCAIIDVACGMLIVMLRVESERSRGAFSKANRVITGGILSPIQGEGNREDLLELEIKKRRV